MLRQHTNIGLLEQAAVVAFDDIHVQRTEQIPADLPHGFRNGLLIGILTVFCSENSIVAGPL